MLASCDVPAWLNDMHDRTRELSCQLVGELQELGVRQIFKAGTDLLRQEESAWYFIHEGFVRSMQRGNLIRYYLNGDLLSLDEGLKMDKSNLLCEIDTEVTILPKTDVLRKLARRPSQLEELIELLELQSKIHAGLAAIHLQTEVKYDIKIRHFKFGELIITEGDAPEFAYILVDGEARVTIGEKEVGRIAQGEVFGEISFLTQQNRVASVSAKTNCLVQVITRQDFLLLMKFRPQICLTMAKSLASRVAKMNAMYLEQL
jgi:CRP-like cAMP-binding protein